MSFTPYCRLFTLFQNLYQGENGQTDCPHKKSSKTSCVVAVAAHVVRLLFASLFNTAIAHFGVFVNNRQNSCHIWQCGGSAFNMDNSANMCYIVIICQVSGGYKHE